MAKYTLNVSELCEQLTGLDFDKMSGLSFDRIDDIIGAAIPHLFSERYTLLDDGDDRIDLERMILEHFWEYEICCYTPSDFILRLNRKLNEIAPYYNQRYESLKLEFPIFEDTDYTEKGRDNKTDKTKENGTSNTKHSDQDVKSFTRNGKVVSDVQENGTTSVVHAGDITEKHTGDITVEEQEKGTTTVDKTNNTTNNHTGTVGVVGQENGTTKTQNDRTETDAGHDVIHNAFDYGHDVKNHVENRKTDWQYNNDTPQNSISGITDSDYLSSYSKNTSEFSKDKIPFSDTLTANYFDGTTQTFVLNDEGWKVSNMVDYDSNQTMSGTKDISKGTTTIDDSQTITHGKGDNQTTTYNEQIGVNATGKDTTTHNKGVDTTTTYGDQIATNKNATDTTTHGKGELGSKSIDDSTTDTTLYGHNIKTDDNANRDFTHAGSYDKSVKGKMGTQSYMQLLQEYRLTMINIYEEIIKELRELFFIIH